MEEGCRCKALFKSDGLEACTGDGLECQLCLKEGTDHHTSLRSWSDFHEHSWKTSSKWKELSNTFTATTKLFVVRSPAAETQDFSGQLFQAKLIPAYKITNYIYIDRERIQNKMSAAPLYPTLLLFTSKPLSASQKHSVTHPIYISVYHSEIRVLARVTDLIRIAGLSSHNTNNFQLSHF